MKKHTAPGESNSGATYGPSEQGYAGASHEQRRGRGLRRRIIGLGLIAATAAGMAYNYNAQPSQSGPGGAAESVLNQEKPVIKRGEVYVPNEATRAAEALALPYKSVAVLGVEDKHEPVKISVQGEDGLDLTGDNAKVVVQAHVEQTDEAKAAAKGDKMSEAYDLKKTTLTGYLIDSDPSAANPNLMRVPDNNHDKGISFNERGEVTAEVYPSYQWESTNGYGEPGRKMTVYVENTAHAVDGAGNSVTLTGQTPVAAFELYAIEGGNEWKQVPLPEQVAPSIESQVG